MILLKNKFFFFFLLFVGLNISAQAGLFGIAPKDRQEFIQARQTFNEGNYEKAVAELTQYIYKTKNIKRREARAYRLLGLSYEQLNLPEKALETYLEALEFHDEDIPLLLSAASLYQRNDLIDQSISFYDRALKEDPENLEALAGQAENYIAIGFYSKAQKYYDRFFELNPTALPIHRARYAYTFLKQRDYKNAFINITMAKTENANEADFWLLSARAYKGLGMLEDALADLDIAISLTSQDKTELTTIKSMWLYQLGRYDQSLAITQQLLQQDPKEELALFMQYMNLQKKGQSQKALQALRQIQELDSASLAQRLSLKLLAQ